MKNLLFLFLVLNLTSLAFAVTLDVTVSTDKWIYQLGEEINITVTAYNPGTEIIGLHGGPDLSSCIFDSSYNWGKWINMPPGGGLLVMMSINPHDSESWHFTYDFDDMQTHPLAAGWHSVTGKIKAWELTQESAPLSFFIAPEPATLILLGAAAPLILRRRR